ncbi:maleylpyruvate isomerase N-terminal domain-containing protein [Knoellia sp. Soil729]|uniref:maleylpyruvate isomerase N-terminal domain-containing protein n=1 Tax=Knoellia sp. Soil729 TaxID=1736394 RepID=UPI0006F23761|nr:maleylpyruvate isomerase N-terminal domain-containing protein [Knoellia sp. Soil729]KRE41923.1 hypothetical protein ASG74_05410 [Knoellia sp. Soil729]
MSEAGHRSEPDSGLGAELGREACVRAFLSCAEVALGLARREEVRSTWERESACARMTVGGLTHHLLGQLRNSARLLAVQAPPDAPVIGLLDHYARAPWVAASRQGGVDGEQLETDNTGARQGADAVLGEASAALDALPHLLAERRDPDTVFIPWQGWSLSTPDFLTTRMMEMVVHGDDLAASVGLETHEHEPVVVASVLRLLTGVSLQRHGQVALMRALSRPQRSSGDISAF